MLISYDYLNKYLDLFDDEAIPTKFFNTSMIQIDKDNYLCLIRFIASRNKNIVPGNSNKCIPELSSRYNASFWWNSWNATEIIEFIGGTQVLKFNINTKEFIKIPIKQSYESDFDIERLEDDLRICIINGIIYIYTNNLEIFIKCKYDNETDTLVIINYFDFSYNIVDINMAPFDIINLETNQNLLYLDWFYGDHILITQLETGILAPDKRYKHTFVKNIKINFDEKYYGFFGKGSYLTENPKHIEKYKSFYGCTPGFSFTTPHIKITENGQTCWIGVGHTKIKNPIERFPYIPGSNVERFRYNLHTQMFDKYGDKYKLHMGSTSPPDCFGYIYLMYFYKLIDNGHDDYDMFISDSYLPLNLDDEYNEYYKFSLIFPMGIILQNIEGIDIIKVSCGEGDYYSILLDFDYNEVMKSINKNIKTLNIETYEYYLLLYRNGRSLLTNLKEETLLETEAKLLYPLLSFDIDSLYDNKYLLYKNKYYKYKQKYIQLKNK